MQPLGRPIGKPGLGDLDGVLETIVQPHSQSVPPGPEICATHGPFLETVAKIAVGGFTKSMSGADLIETQAQRTTQCQDEARRARFKGASHFCHSV